MRPATPALIGSVYFPLEELASYPTTTIFFSVTIILVEHERDGYGKAPALN